MGLPDAQMDEYGYVYATITRNVDKEGARDLFLRACGYGPRRQWKRCKAIACI